MTRALIPRRAQLREGGIDGLAVDRRAAHADQSTLEASPGRVRIAQDRDARRGQAADHRREFSTVVAALGADSFPVLDFDFLEGLAKTLPEAAVLQIEAGRG